MASLTELGSSMGPDNGNKFNPKKLDPFQLADRTREILDEKKGPRAILFTSRQKEIGRRLLSQADLKKVREEHKADPDKIFRESMMAMQVFDGVIFIGRPTSS